MHGQGLVEADADLVKKQSDGVRIGLKDDVSKTSCRSLVFFSNIL
jgi:hypothetical protein